MPHFTLKRLDELKNSFKNKKIAIIGDMMIDGYYWGDVKEFPRKLPFRLWKSIMNFIDSEAPQMLP